MPIAVTDLALAPVKGLRVVSPDAVELRTEGPAGDRDFLIVEAADDALVSTARHPELLRVEPAWSDGALTLRFPDGSTVTDEPAPGEPAVTRNYAGRELRGHRVDGPLAAALSEHVGRSVRLIRRDPGITGADDAPVSLMSVASLQALAPELGGEVPDPRRFRMTLTIDGVEPWAEHGWTGRKLAVGAAVLRVVDPVPRCVVTTRDPERGTRDLPVLKALATLLGKKHVDFGVWCEVVRPGVVRRGDPVELAA
jgi:uncharacterized protein